MENLGFTFYRMLDPTNKVDFGKKIIERSKTCQISSKEYFDIPNSIKLTFRTNYPGLSLGLGYEHISSENDDFKLGFSFDFTTGLPYIPGSSLKGTLRSMFPADGNDHERLAFINDVLGKSLTYKELYEIEKSIFGKNTDDRKSIDNITTKDIFYDSYFNTDTGEYLADDYITPHKGEITSPDPLKFLKIAPGTKVILQIGLSENPLFTKEERLKLYSEILNFTGIGAKTNVGYGTVEQLSYEYHIADKDIAEKDPGKFFESIDEHINDIEAKKRKQKQDQKLSKLPLLIQLKKKIDELTENKEIYDLLAEQTEKLSEIEKEELFTYIKGKIGDRPNKCKPAPKKWACKIHDLFQK